MGIINRRRFLESVGAVAGTLTVAGCVGPAKTLSAESVHDPTFYPAAPSPPRIQHLKTLKSESDVVARTSGFADFVAGSPQDEIALARPYGAAVYNGAVYVADTAAAAVAVFDLKARSFRVFFGSGSGRLQKPINITIDGDGTRYICDTGRKQIVCFDASDKFIRALGSGTEFTPVDCVVDGPELLLTDIEHHRVVRINKVSGEIVNMFGKPGSAKGELFHPTNLALGPAGDVYIVETSNFRVQRFKQNGATVRTYGRVGDAPGQFSRPKGIAIDQNGRLFVGDSAFGNVQIFANDGQLLMEFGRSPVARESLNLPASVSIHYEDLDLFQHFAAPDFLLEFVILVVSQFGPNKVDVFGFGKMRGLDYTVRSPPLPAHAKTRRQTNERNNT